MNDSRPVTRKPVDQSFRPRQGARARRTASHFEESSHHVATGLEYLPAVARRLHHGRDLAEPFDFLTWFEFAPADSAGFEELVQRLRATEEWTYVEREVDIRLTRQAHPLH